MSENRRSVKNSFDTQMTSRLGGTQGEEKTEFVVTSIRSLFDGRFEKQHSHPIRGLAKQFLKDAERRGFVKRT